MILRKARISDVDGMAALINFYAEKGKMLYRTIPSLYQKIRDYSVIEKDGAVIGIGGLHILWKDLAEICSLAIDPHYVKNGLGTALVHRLYREGRKLKIAQVFALTYQPGFFEKCGFTRIDKESLPQKVWMECVNCPKFPNCDETALIKTVT